jgi:TolB-like protein
MLVATRWFARSIVAVLCTSLAVTLMGATSSLLPPTTLVIFPFTPAVGADPNSGPEYSKQLGAALTALGGVTVVMADTATVQADYLRTAKAAGAEYYLMGHITPPLNNALSVVEQLVSTRSGIVVWSQTARVSSDDDVAGQAPTVKTAVVSLGTRGFLAILNATPGPVRTVPPTPAPKRAAKAAGGPIVPGTVTIGPDGVPRLPNEAYGYSSKPTAPPKIYASASKPSRFVVLTLAGKSVTPGVREYTAESLVKALKRRGQTAAEGDPQVTGHHLPGPDLCNQTGAGYLVFGTIEASLSVPAEENNWVKLVNTALTITAYNCVAGKFERASLIHGRGNPWGNAVDNTTDTATTRYLMKLATLAKSA